MSEEEYVCGSCNKIVERIERAQTLSTKHLSLDEETREIVDHFVREYINFQGPLHEDVHYAIQELNAKDCNKVTISFSGKTAQGKKISLNRKVLVSIA